jgi:5-methylthioadenosine/S-adenosylhomocysteine deaminase
MAERARDLAERSILTSAIKLAWSAGRPLDTGQGYFNAHTHLCRADWKPTAESLPQFLESILAFRAQQTRVELVESARAAVMAMRRIGIRGYVSHQNHRHIQDVIDGVQSIPLLHGFARMCLDSPKAPSRMRETPAEAVERTVLLAESNPSIDICFGPLNLAYASSEMFEAYANTPEVRTLGLHTHVAESPEIVEAVKSKYGATEVELLNELGCLDERTTLVHCTCVEPTDIPVIARSGARVVICPRSAFSSSLLGRLVNAGIPILVGDDAFEPGNPSVTADYGIVGAAGGSIA